MCLPWPSGCPCTVKTANDYFIQAEIDLWTARWPSDQNRCVLDLGCGSSPYRQFISRGGWRVVAVDVEMRGSLTAVLADAGALPFPSASFDGVLFSEVLEHMPDPESVVRELARVTKPGGTLFLSTPLHYSIHEIPADYFRPTEFGIRAMLGRSGFSIERLARRGGVFCVMLTIILQLAYGVFEAPGRLPVIGRLYRAAIFPILRKSLEVIAYAIFRVSSVSTALLVPLDRLRGPSRSLMLWTNGYCVQAIRGASK